MSTRSQTNEIATKLKDVLSGGIVGAIQVEIKLCVGIDDFHTLYAIFYGCLA